MNGTELRYELKLTELRVHFQLYLPVAQFVLQQIVNIKTIRFIMDELK